MFHYKDKFKYLLFVLAFAIAAPVLAEESESSRATVLEEVIVTAQKRSESLQETPISISAYGEDDLEQMSIYEVGQIADYTPNLQMRKQPSNNDNYGYSIRGLSSAGTDLLKEPTVGLYVDGVYNARITGSAFDMVNPERIEVLRGPQGTLYGRNTIGGAINLISQKPFEELGFVQQLSAGNRGYTRSSTTLDTGKIGDFAAKFSYVLREHEGYVRNSIHGNMLGEQESDAYRLAVRWTPSDTLTVDYTYDVSERLSNGSQSQIVHVKEGHAFVGGAIFKQAAAFADPNRKGQLPMAFAPDADIVSDVDNHAITLEWELDGMTFKSITASRKWNSPDGKIGVNAIGSEFGSFQSDGLTVLDGRGGLVPEGTYVSMFNAQRDSRQDQFTQEFQLIGKALDDKLQYTVGLYYFEEEVWENNPQFFVLPALIAYGRLPAATQNFLCQGSCFGKDTLLGLPIFIYGAENESTAVYGQFTYAFSDEFDVTLGMRYTMDDKKAFLTSTPIIRDEGLDRVDASNDWSNFNPSLTLSYTWSPDASAYFTYTTGYRSGGYNARASTSSGFTTPFNEENVDSYEFGLKSHWLDSRVRFNAAIFHMVYEDKQVNQFEAGSGGASATVVNAGEQESDGFEIELTAIPLEGVKVIASYGYLDAKFNKFVTNRLDPVTGFPTNNVNEDIADIAKVGHAPKNTGSLILQYEFEPFDFGRLTFRVDGTYTGKVLFHTQLNLTDSSEAQKMVNARLTLSDIPVGKGNIKVAAWGRNLGNKKYREWGIDFGALGFSSVNFKELRSYGLDVSYGF